MIDQPKSRSLLKRHPLLATDDLDAVRESTGRMLVRHQVEVRGRVPFRTLINGVQGRDLSLAYVDCPTPLTIDCEQPCSQHTVYLHLSGHASHHFNGRDHEAHRRQAVMVNPGDREKLLTGPTRALLLSLNPKMVLPALKARQLPQPESGKLNGTFSLANGPGKTLRNLCLQLAGELDQPTVASGGSATLELYRARILEALLDAISSQTVSPSPRIALPGKAGLEELEHWILSNLDQTLGVDELAARMGMTVRTVQHLFRKHHGLTPKAFVRARKLDEARRQLQSGTCTSVGEVALGLGFLHLGRFAIAYRERFGETPRETLNHSS